MAAPRIKRRMAPRKQTASVHVSSVTSLDDFTKIARNCEVIEASSNGLLLKIARDAFVPASLRRNLNIDALVGNRIFLRLADMDLEISGVVVRTKLLGKAGYIVAVDYSADSPEYWRECLTDLLPRPGELDE